MYYIACRFSKIKIVELLIRHGAGIDLKNDDFRTPLHQG